ncbi:MAG: serine/threonine-protein phosphatase, partial [Spirochaetaceae bacterium]
SSGFLLGILDEAVQGDDSYKFQLKKGDLLVLYSDGITEAKNVSRKDSHDGEIEREMFGEEKLHKIISENRSRTPKQLIDVILKAVDSWMSEQDDDITLAVIKRKR